MTINLGIIGAGRVGRLHANTLMTRIPGAKLLAVADIFEEAARSAAADFGVPDYSADPAELINSGDINAIVICSSTDTHCHFIIEAARAGKQIFCEKPIDLRFGRDRRGAGCRGRAGRSAADRLQSSI